MSNELENQELNEEENTGDDENQDTEEDQDERITQKKKQVESRRQQAILRTALVIGILILINIISINIFFRIDLTGNRIYTLSNASKAIVGKLDDKLVIKAYFTDNLPAPYNNTRRYLQEILDDYRNYSHGQLEYEIISPSDEKELEEDAQKYGIQPVQVQTIKDDRAEALKAYMGIVFLYGGKQEVIPFLGNTENLEYEITGVIKRISEKELKKVGVLGGDNMPGLDKIGKANQFFSKFYTTTTIDASKNNPIPPDISVLLVFSPKAQQNQMMQQQQQTTPTVPESVKFAIDQYIMHGGKVIFMLDKITVSAQQQFQFAQNVPTGFDDMLENYGIKYTNTIIKDKECAYISIPMQQGPLQFYTQVPFPWYPRITNINKELPAFSGLGQVFLAFTCEIDTTLALSKGINVDPLLITSPKTGIDKEISIIMVSGQMPPDSVFKFSNIVVGSVFSGSFQSFYKGKTIPIDTSVGSSPAPGNITERSADNSKIIAIGNRDFAIDDFRGPDENIIFLANMIDYLADDVGLSEIRMKDANPKPLDMLEDSTKRILKWGMLFVPPLLVLLYGITRWRKRKISTE